MGGQGYTQRFFTNIDFKKEELVDSTSASTSSTSYVLVGNCTITPTEQGDYVVMFTTEVLVQIANNQVSFAIFVNGVEQIGSVKTVKIITANALQEVTLIKKVSWTTGAIEVRFKLLSGSMNVTSTNRVLIIMK